MFTLHGTSTGSGTRSKSGGTTGYYAELFTLHPDWEWNQIHCFLLCSTAPCTCPIPTPLQCEHAIGLENKFIELVLYSKRVSFKFRQNMAENVCFNQATVIHRFCFFQPPVEEQRLICCVTVFLLRGRKP